jgi:hypothetical protein
MTRPFSEEHAARICALLEDAGYDVVGVVPPREDPDHGGEWHPATPECPGNWPIQGPTRLDPDYGVVSVDVRCDCRRIG